MSKTVGEDCMTKLHNPLENDQKIGVHRDDRSPHPNYIGQVSILCKMVQIC